jgi:hypothetical protein
MIRTFNMNALLSACILSLSAGLTGCSDDDTKDTADKSADAGDAGDASSGDAATPEPLYVVSTGVTQADQLIGYLTTTRSLGEGTKFDLDKAVELSGASWIFSRPEQPSSVYAASLTEPTLVRWEVRGEGDFVEHETLSFADLGLQRASSAARAPIFSDEKSYFVDSAQNQLVIWNPSEMSLLGTISLGDVEEGGLKPQAEWRLLVRGDKLVVILNFSDADDWTVLGESVTVVTVDTKTDEVIDRREQSRSSLLALSSESSDGTAYFSPYSTYVALREIGPKHGATPFVARILPGDTTFDPDYSLDLSELVGGRPAGDFTLLDDETALIRAWHPEEVVDADGTKMEILDQQAAFYWWRWNIGDAEAVQIPDQEPGARGATIITLDEKTYSIRYTAELKSSALSEITPSGEFVPALEGPGQIIGGGVLRVQ